MLSVAQYLAPQLQRETLICSAQDQHKMVLKSLNGFLCDVAPVVVRWDTLVSHCVAFDCGFELCRTLIV